jgi:hypothetical protein
MRKIPEGLLDCYVYIYFDPRTGKPFYVGKGSGDRLYYHLYETKENTINGRKYNKIQKIIRETGQIPIIIVYAHGLSDDDAYALETQLIQSIGTVDMEGSAQGPLLNFLTDGRPPHYKGKDHPLSGTKQDPIWLKHNSEGQKKRFALHPESHGMLGKHMEPEAKAKMIASMCKLNYCIYDPDGERYIANNLTQFCKDHKLSQGNMTNVINGRIQHCKRWTGYKIDGDLKDFDPTKYPWIPVPIKVKKVKERKTKDKSYLLQYTYRMVSPKNVIYLIKNLRKFCRDYDLNQRNMCRALKQLKRCKSHRGWRGTKVPNDYVEPFDPNVTVIDLRQQDLLDISHSTL